MQINNTHFANIVLDRLKEYFKINTDLGLAKHLGIKANTLSTWRKRNTLDYPLIISFCDNIDLNWLFQNSHNENASLKDEASSKEKDDIIISQAKRIMELEKEVSALKKDGTYIGYGMVAEP